MKIKIKVENVSKKIKGVEVLKDISFPRSAGVLIENPSFISGYTGVKNLQVLESIQKRIDDVQIRKNLNRLDSIQMISESIESIHLE